MRPRRRSRRSRPGPSPPARTRRPRGGPRLPARSPSLAVSQDGATRSSGPPEPASGAEAIASSRTRHGAADRSMRTPRREGDCGGQADAPFDVGGTSDVRRGVSFRTLAGPAYLAIHCDVAGCPTGRCRIAAIAGPRYCRRVAMAARLKSPILGTGLSRAAETNKRPVAFSAAGRLSVSLMGARRLAASVGHRAADQRLADVRVLVEPAGKPAGYAAEGCDECRHAIDGSSAAPPDPRPGRCPAGAGAGSRGSARWRGRGR